MTGFIQGAGLGLLFVPLTTVTFATLEPEQRADGTGLYNLSRNIGSSVGISVVSYLLIRNEQINHATIASHVTATNHGFDNSVVLHAWGPWTAGGRAALDQVIQMQAAIISYVDDFKLMMILSLMAIPLVLLLRRPAPRHAPGGHGATSGSGPSSFGLSPNALMVLLCIAGVGCCVAMSMPQVHIVAYCGDLGYGPARGAEMLAAMMGFGIISRIAAGFIADRIGGLETLLIGSVLQAVALFLYLWFDSLVSLYLISALFGLFQGGIVPMYAIIVRQYFSPAETGTRLGIVLMATLVGMALGGWMSGVIFDFTGSYQAAFLNGMIWNLLNGAIVLWLLLRPGRRLAVA